MKAAKRAPPHYWREDTRGNAIVVSAEMIAAGKPLGRTEYGGSAVGWLADEDMARSLGIEPDTVLGATLAKAKATAAALLAGATARQGAVA